MNIAALWFKSFVIFRDKVLSVAMCLGYTVPHIAQPKHDLNSQKINNPMGVCMYLYLFTSMAWKFICTVCSAV